MYVDLRIADTKASEDGVLLDARCDRGKPDLSGTILSVLGTRESRTCNKLNMICHDTPSYYKPPLL